MRFSHVAILCACGGFIAMPAFAQNQAQSHNTGMQGQHQGTDNGMGPRQHLMQDLQKAGFTHIQIEPEAFVVHAVNSDGDPVLMRITPDTMTAVTAMQANGSQGSGSHGGGSSNGQSGTTTQ